MTDTTSAAPTQDSDEHSGQRLVIELVRIAVGWTFLWAFFDKLFGLGFSTCRNPDDGTIDTMCDAAFLQGGSPTYGVLEFGTQGSHTGDLFSWMATSGPDTVGWVDWLFMFGIGAIGISLTFGFMVRIGAAAGALMYTFMYLAIAVWPDTNPFWDSHTLGVLLCVGLIVGDAGRTLGVGGWWRSQEIVQKNPILR